MENKRTPGFAGRSGGHSASATASTDLLPVTVISTTPEGTTAALNAANCIGKDLGASITLLTTEVAEFDIPLDLPPLLMDSADVELSSESNRSGAQNENAVNRICVCRDPVADVPRVLRRKALVVIGGKRHWWISREERLEKALQRFGHHVIFIDVGR